MATRSLIALETSEGIHDCIYVHWDGHPETRLPILKHYNTREQVQSLIELGDCSAIYNTLEDSKFYHRDMGGDLNISKNIQNIQRHAKIVIANISIQ